MSDARPLSLSELRTLEAEIAAELARVQSAIEVLTAPRFSYPAESRRGAHLRLVHSDTRRSS